MRLLRRFMKKPKLVEEIITPPLVKNRLYYGDNIDVLRNKIATESVDLCYIDPPFNSKRNYFQIYNNIGSEDRAQAQAFEDTWEWGEEAVFAFKYLTDVTNLNNGKLTEQTVELIKGLEKVLKRGSLFAYVVHMTLRIVEIHRVLKKTGSFYLHCDPTASHYLKLVCDTIFCGQGGDFRNEIVWCYRKWSIKQSQFVSNHDVVLFYSKSTQSKFNTLYSDLSPGTIKRWKGMKQQAIFDDSGKRLASSEDVKSEGSPMADWWEISVINPAAKERLGYPTQKPEALLERIIKASSNEGDVILDAYCGCGTSIAVAQRLKRQWIGVDITYQSISLILYRLQKQYRDDWSQIEENLLLDGVPRDMDSAIALANRKDDKTRKEFEKWAVLTYCQNQAVINEKKGADKGIDGVAYFMIDKEINGKAIFQVKSGNVKRDDIAKLNSDRLRENAQFGILITLNEPTKPMKQEVLAAGKYKHPLIVREDNHIKIVTIADIFNGQRIDLPMMRLDLVKSAKEIMDDDRQKGLF
jgi:DNA modification methylase